MIFQNDAEMLNWDAEDADFTEGCSCTQLHPVRGPDKLKSVQQLVHAILIAPDFFLP